MRTDECIKSGLQNWIRGLYTTLVHRNSLIVFFNARQSCPRSVVMVFENTLVYVQFECVFRAIFPNLEHTIGNRKQKMQNTERDGDND